MIRPKQPAGNHRNNNLREPCLEIISLDDKRRAELRATQVRVGEEHQDHITAFAYGLWRHHSHRKWPSQGCPSPPRTSLSGRAILLRVLRQSHVPVNQWIAV